MDHVTVGMNILELTDNVNQTLSGCFDKQGGRLFNHPYSHRSTVSFWVEPDESCAKIAI
jgi:hypothetical protein